MCVYILRTVSTRTETNDRAEVYVCIRSELIGADTIRYIIINLFRMTRITFRISFCDHIPRTDQHAVFAWVPFVKFKTNSFCYGVAVIGLRTWQFGIDAWGKDSLLYIWVDFPYSVLKNILQILITDLQARKKAFRTSGTLKNFFSYVDITISILDHCFKCRNHFESFYRIDKTNKTY